MLTPAKTQFPESCSRRRIWASLRLRPRAVRGALGQEPPRQPLLLKGAMQSAVSFSCHEEHELHVHGSSPCTTPSSASLSPSAARLWRPAAQRNLRNQWSKLLSSKKLWESGASEGRSNATALVNAYLSRRYMPNMNLGVLKDMPEIRQKAGEKLARKQEQCQSKLLSSYKDLVGVVYQLVEACGSMRCFLKGSSDGPLIQFTHHSEDTNDPGDGGGIAVFTFWPLPYFEKLAKELVGMYVLELSFKRLIVVQLLSIACQDISRVQIDELNWSSELYEGEFDGLDLIGLFSKEKSQPIPPGNTDFHSDNPVTEKNNQNPDREVLQVYLTAWISDVNIDMKRFDEILSMVEEEMKVKIS